MKPNGQTKRLQDRSVISGTANLAGDLYEPIDPPAPVIVGR